MILSIPKLKDAEDIGFDVDGQECPIPEDAGKLRAPIHVEAHIRKIGTEIAIEGRISTIVEMLCSRCLKPHDEILCDTFEATYQPQPDSSAWKEELELNEADLTTCYYEGETLSLADVVQDQLLLLLPIQPLCDPACAGLCPSCGKNLNKGSCHCATQAIDPRLAVLGQLLRREPITHE